MSIFYVSSVDFSSYYGRETSRANITNQFVCKNELLFFNAFNLIIPIISLSFWTFQELRVVLLWMFYYSMYCCF